LQGAPTQLVERAASWSGALEKRGQHGVQAEAGSAQLVAASARGAM
jgi:hypothetical protein